MRDVVTVCMGGPANGMEVSASEHPGKWLKIPHITFLEGVRFAVYERSGDVWLYVGHEEEV